MHEYDHHIGDYTRDTVGLSLAEDGAYRRLMDQYYASELPLPSDVREVYRLARAASTVDRKAVSYILDRYFILRDDGWHQNRIDREIAEFHGKSEAARASAKLRWDRESERRNRRRGDANAMPMHSERNANASVDKYANASDSHGKRICETDAARARRLPPSALPSSELQNRDVGVDQPYTPTADAETATANGNIAIGNTEPRKAKVDFANAGQQWSKPAYVEATAKTLGIARRPNEDDDAFKDRVYSAVNERRRGAAH